MESTTSNGAARVGRVAVWVLIVAEMLGMGLAGAAKFLAPDVWTALFEGWGYPARFAFVIGGTEAIAALLLLVPRMASYAALLLIVVMLGALGTVLTHPGNLGPVTPVIHIVVLATIAAARWKDRWR